jgi:DNA-binding beta-propeller fold protein YncE
VKRGKAYSLVLFGFVFLFPCSIAATEYAFVTTSDYSTGSSSVIYLDGSYTTLVDVEELHSDAVSRYYEGLIYVVNRMGGDNIQVLDPGDGFSTIRQFSVGSGSNPQDIAFVSGTKAYVSLGNETEMLIVNPVSGAHTGSIDLSIFADGDGIPEMDCMILVGDRLFVSIQRLDRNMYWLPVAPSYIAVIDTNADTLLDCDPGTPGIQAIELVGTDPYKDIHFDPYTGLLYVTCVGWWGIIDCGVETIDPVTLNPTGYMLSESNASGDINDVAVFSATTGYAVVTNASFDNILVRFDPSTGELTDTLYTPGGYWLSDIEISPGGELFLCDRTPTNPGVRIYGAVTGLEIPESPIDVGLPPFDITFSVPIQTGCIVPAAASLGQNYPNPFNPTTTIPFYITEPGFVDLAIYDCMGRLVRRLEQRVFEAGRRETVWDGACDSGRETASGVYFVRLRAGRYVSTRKLILLR